MLLGQQKVFLAFLPIVQIVSVCSSYYSVNGQNRCFPGNTLCKYAVESTRTAEVGSFSHQFTSKTGLKHRNCIFFPKVKELLSARSLQSGAHPHGGGEEGAVVRKLPHRAALSRH